MLIHIHFNVERAPDLRSRSADENGESICRSVGYGKAIGLSKVDYFLVILCCWAELFGKLSHAKKLMVIRTVRILKLTQQTGQCGLMRTGSMIASCNVCVLGSDPT